MTRQHLTFRCAEETLVGTLDAANGEAGLLLVSGGNEIRSGAFSGQAWLAATIAAAGFPVFRFDRRGIGDSTGDNGGFRTSGPDIEAALRSFREACPDMRNVVAFGNCDAASALMLAGGEGCSSLVLANPWTYDDADEGEAATPPPDAIRARYAERLRNPREWLRLLSGGVNLRKLAHGLLSAARPSPPPSALLEEMRQGLETFSGPVRILLADRDRTAQAFTAAWPSDDVRIQHREQADHAFSDPADRDWLVAQLLSALNEQAGQFDMR